MNYALKSDCHVTQGVYVETACIFFLLFVNNLVSFRNLLRPSDLKKKVGVTSLTSENSFSSMFDLVMAWWRS